MRGLQVATAGWGARGSSVAGRSISSACSGNDVPVVGGWWATRTGWDAAPRVILSPVFLPPPSQHPLTTAAAISPPLPPSHHRCCCAPPLQTSARTLRARSTSLASTSRQAPPLPPHSCWDCVAAKLMAACTPYPALHGRRPSLPDRLPVRASRERLVGKCVTSVWDACLRPLPSARHHASLEDVSLAAAAAEAAAGHGSSSSSSSSSSVLL